MNFGRLTTAALTLLCALLLGACNGNVHPDEPTALTDPDNWPVWGRTEGEQHYSPLDQIDTGNVGELKLAWYYELPSENTATGPVEADGKLFVSTGHNYIRAFDAASGKLLWEYDSKTREKAGIVLRFGWGNKGIAYYDGRVFLGTQDGRVIALDAESGKVAWELRDYPEGELRYINGAPRILDGKLIIGHGGADFSPVRGYVTAYDPASGERLWRFYTIPGNPADGFENKAMEMAAGTWTGEWWKNSGGGTAWNAFSYDPELDLIYIGVGNGYPFNQALRSPGGGDNLFLASIVAVKADSGEYVWHYQVCPGEQWDCTATQDMSLATIEIDGKPRKVLLQAPKNGFFYVLDRATGELISAEKYTKVTWAEKIDMKTGRPVENPGVRYHGKKGMFEMWPGVRGAHGWQPQSYSPRTGLLYLPVIEGASMIGDEGIDLKTVPRVRGLAVNAHPDPILPGAQRSYLKAWDPVKQEARWTVELPGNWPGGVMSTAGDLVFQGRIDGRFVALDADSGKEMWSFKTEAPVVGPPISYRVGNTQYVTVITGMGGGGGGLFSIGLQDYPTDYRLPRRVLTFALDGKAKLPPPAPLPPKRPLDDPDYKADEALAQKGMMLYFRSDCALCHGISAVPGGTAPDLRTSAYILDGKAFRAVVKQGALVEAGMPVFGELDESDVEAIRQYLRSQSQALETKPPSSAQD